jgi:hypothetical protein
MKQIIFAINHEGDVIIARATLEGDQLMKLNVRCKAKDLDKTMKMLTLMKCA